MIGADKGWFGLKLTSSTSGDFKWLPSKAMMMHEEVLMHSLSDNRGRSPGQH